MIRALVCPALADDFSTLKIETRTLPPPGKGEVRVKMRAASLNFPDVLMTQGKYQLKPALPFVPRAGFVKAATLNQPSINSPRGLELASCGSPVRSARSLARPSRFLS